MAAERFDRIDRNMSDVKADVAELKTDGAALKTDVAGLKTDVAGLRSDVTGLDTRVGQVENGLTGVAARVDRAHADLKQHMGVLYEQLRDDIRAITFLAPDLERRWKADDAVLRDDIDRRLDPLETAVRKHFGTTQA